MQSFSIITYNLYYSRAVSHARTVLTQYQPDFFAVQEIITEERVLKELEQGDMVMADHAHSFIKYAKTYGNALFYNSARFECLDVQVTELPHGFSDLIMFFLQGMQNLRTAIYGRFRDRETGKEVGVCNVHLNSIGTAQLRLSQLEATTEGLPTELPLVVCGDLNFYSKKRLLQDFIDRSEFTEATADIGITFRHTQLGIPVTKNKLDYVLYRNLMHQQTERLPQDGSDHYPIRSVFGGDAV
jgi:endonuclease/exonuclease/phosphatase family metal-dependent hydrolase